MNATLLAGLIVAASPAAVEGLPIGPADSSRLSAPVDRDAVHRFALRLDEALTKERFAGVYLRGSSVGFPLQGHGVVFVTRAARSPLAGPALYRRVLQSGRVAEGAGVGPRQSLLGEPQATTRQEAELAGAGEQTGPASKALHERYSMESVRAELRRSRDEVARLRTTAKSLAARLSAVIGVTLSEVAPSGPSAPSGGAPTASVPTTVPLVVYGPDPLPLLEVAHLEASAAALEARVDALEFRLEAAESGAGRRTQRGDMLGRLAGRVVDVILREGRSVTPDGVDRLTVVLLFAPFGEDEAVSALQITARRADLPPTSDPVSLDEARKKVIVLKQPL